MAVKFIADVHLGKLAKALRLLGFDTLYQNSFNADELKSIALKEERTVLSRSAAFSKNENIQSLVIKSEKPAEQLKQVVSQLHLANNLYPFSRCLVCTGQLDAVAKQKVSDAIPENTSRCFNEFWQCSSCRRVYWKGSHYERMRLLLEEIERDTCQG